MITEKVQDFLRNNPELETPFVIFDLDILKEKYQEFKDNFSYTDVFYAVKCNPAPEVIKTLSELGSSFDVASIEEVELCLSLNIDPKKLSWGSTIKKASLIKKAYEKGVELFATDSEEDLLKIAQNAPNSKVYCRIVANNDSALWPLSSKFGCSVDIAEELLVQAKNIGLIPYGVSFHVGSQQLDVSAWGKAIGSAAVIFKNLKANHDISLEMINLGGGYPAYGYVTEHRDLGDYRDAINEALRRNFGKQQPRVLVEPGRFLVADAGVLKSEVVLVAKKRPDTDLRWVYLDIGLYGGLAETMGESIKYNIFTDKDGEKRGKVNLAGPTCDGMDVLYKRYKYRMPLSLTSGDMVYILSTGAYTTSYSSISFNGFKPLKDYYI